MSRTHTRSRTRTSRPYHAALHRMETLEPRSLLSSVTSYNPSPAFAPTTTTYDSHGNLWVLDLDIDNVHAKPTIDRIVGGTIVQRITLATDNPSSLTAGPDGNLYFLDSLAHAVDKVDLTNISTPVLSSTTITSAFDGPYALTVTNDNAVWFASINGAVTATSSTYDNQIGRLDASGSVSFYEFSSTHNAQIASLSANGNSVYVGFQAAQASLVNAPLGQNQLAVATFSVSGISATAPQVLSSGNAAADANNLLSSVVTDADGSVWYALANNPGSPLGATQGADRLVHAKFEAGSFSLLGAYTLPDSYAPNVSATVTGVGVVSLRQDGFGRIWFVEGASNAVGYLDPTITFDPLAAKDNRFTAFALSQPIDTFVTMPFGLAVSADPALPQAWVTTSSANKDPFDFENTPPAPSIVRIDPDLPPVTGFSGSATDLGGPEDVAMTNFVIATFEAPIGTYTASISWGSGPDSPGTVVNVGGNHYTVLVPSKTFLSQGTFTGVVTLKKADNSTLATLGFTSVITDTPLKVTSYAVQPLLGKIVVATLTFTDDVDAPASNFHATITWGDGTTTAGTVVRDVTTPGRFVVLALHVYKKKGTYAVKTSITTAETLAAITSSSATVNVNV